MLAKLFGAKTSWTLNVLLIVADMILSAVIIYKIAYTEIDWIAYMEEVQGFLDGERDYTKIQGNTGPLVYPAGFLYIFTALKWMTQNGTDIFTAQCIFAGIYIINLVVVLALYTIDGGVSALATVILILSKRIHSIYMLRMFNDCIAVFCGYLAILLFTNKNWRIGCLIYSIGVSIKMNMLLYAPGVLLVLLMGTGFIETVICLSICAIVQIVLGFPFLSTYPIQYIQKAFELSRVFTYKWTVNFKFLPEEVFTSKPLSIILLVLTILCFILFAVKWVTEIQVQLRHQGSKSTSILGLKNTLSAHFILVTIFTSNFIGVAFARTLHYQFYCWYFHTIPYLLWHCSSVLLPVPLKLALFIAIEVCFNVFPATAWSSGLLQVSHLILLLGLYYTPVPYVLSVESGEREPEENTHHLRKAKTATKAD